MLSRPVFDQICMLILLIFPAGISASIVAFSQFVGACFAVLLVERLGRKVLLILSDAVMTVSILMLAIYFFLKDNVSVTCDDFGSTTDSTGMFPQNSTVGLPECVPQDGMFDPEVIDKLGWMPLVSLIIYILFFAVGKILYVIPTDSVGNP